MSARIKKCVLRVPCERVGIRDAWAFADAHPELFRWDGPCPRFTVAPTQRGFFDCVLHEWITDELSCGKSRGLTEAERRKYGPLFRARFPDIRMEDVRFVEFCWYDGCEAPDYYEGERR